MEYDIVDGLGVAAEDVGEDGVEVVLLLVGLFIICLDFINKSFGDDARFPVMPVDLLSLLGST